MKLGVNYTILKFAYLANYVIFKIIKDVKKRYIYKFILLLLFKLQFYYFFFTSIKYHRL